MTVQTDHQTKAERLAAIQAEIDAQHDAAAARQARRDKRGARERVIRLLDEGSFEELGTMVRHRAGHFGMAESNPYGDGVVTGFGTIDGRKVAIFSQDFTVFGGSLGEAFAEKVVRIMDLAEQYGCPIIGINDSAGARIQEGVEGLAGYGDVFFRNVRASGVVPQISIIAGPCAGGAVYSPAMTDFVIMVEKTSQMFITGPDVIKTVTGETVTHEQLGGADTHNRVSGVAHFAAADEDDLNELVRVLLSYIPSNNLDNAPRFETGDDRERLVDELDTIAPENSNKPYDMHEVIRATLDDGDFLEVQAAFARNIICGFGRLDGYSVGVVANQPQVLAGTLDIDASEKAARFVRFCDAFSIPLGRLRGRARISSRRGSGVCRDHPAWLQAPLRLLRGNRAAGNGYHPQSVRRSLCGDELAQHRSRFRLLLANRRNRRHGPGSRGQSPVSPGARGCG